MSKVFSWVVQFATGQWGGFYDCFHFIAGETEAPKVKDLIHVTQLVTGLKFKTLQSSYTVHTPASRRWGSILWILGALSSSNRERISYKDSKRSLIHWGRIISLGMMAKWDTYNRQNSTEFYFKKFYTRNNYV